MNKPFPRVVETPCSKFALKLFRKRCASKSSLDFCWSPIPSLESDSHLADLQAECQKVWTAQVYCNPDRQPVNRAEVGHKYGQPLAGQAQQPDLPPLTGSDLRATVASWPRAKKGGADCWEATHFKTFPRRYLTV